MPTLLDDGKTPGLRVIGGAGLASLVPALVERVRARNDPFAPLVVAVPNREVQVFAQDAIARALGVCMHIEMTTIERAVTEHARAAGVPLRAWSARTLARALLFVVEDARARDDELWRSVRPLVEAVAPTHDGLAHSVDAAARSGAALDVARATRFALHMAHLFVSAHATHPSHVVALARGDRGAPADPRRAWQGALLSRATRIEGAPASHGFSSEIARALVDGEAHAPLSLVTFGHASMSPLERALVCALAERAPVWCLHDGVVPADANVDGESFLARSLVAARETRDALTARASMFSVVDDVEGERARPLDALAAALGRAPGALVDDALRARVRVVGAPGPGREAEIVAGAIWDHVRSHAGARFTDVNVVSARYERQIAWLEDRFARFHGLRHTTPPGGRASRLLDVATALLDLGESGFSRDRVLDVLTHPCCRASDALTDASARASDAGIFLGRDGDDEELVYLNGAPRFHWEQGLSRLAFSTWLDGASTIGEGKAALSSIALAPGARPGARALHAWATSLLADLDALRVLALPGATWARVLEDLFRTVLAPRDGGDGAHWAALLGAVRALADVDDAVPPLGAPRPGAIALVDDDPTPFGFSAAIALVKDGLAAGGGRKGHFGAEGAPISRLHENRGVPFSLVVVTGMDERAFPGRDVVDPLDPRLAWGAPPTTRPARALAFAQAVLSAKDALVVTYDAHDPARDAALSPSPLVLELVHALGGLPLLRAPLDAHDATEGVLSTLAHDEGARRRTDARALRDALLPALASADGAIDTGLRAWQRVFEDDAGVRARAAVLAPPAAPLTVDRGARSLSLFTFTDVLKDDVDARAAGRGLKGFGLAPDEERAVSHEPFSVDERAAHALARAAIPALLVESPRARPSDPQIDDAVWRALSAADLRGELPFGPLRAPDVEEQVRAHVDAILTKIDEAGGFARGFDALVTLGPPRRDTTGRRALPLLALPSTAGAPSVVVRHERGLLFGPPDDRLLVELSASRSAASGDPEYRQRIEILLFVAAGEIAPSSRVSTRVLGLGRSHGQGVFHAPTLDEARAFLSSLAAMLDGPLDAPLFPLRRVEPRLATLLAAIDDDGAPARERDEIARAVIDDIARPEPDDDVNARLKKTSFGPGPALRARDGFRLPSVDEVHALARARFALLHAMARP